MAFYIPYVAGSVSLAYLYSYAYGPSIETMANFEAGDAEVPPEASLKEDKSNEAYVEPEVVDDKLIIVGVSAIDISARVTKLETYYSCYVCNMNLPINSFSKNQQKKIKGVWKCKKCTSISA
jgi:hypothetical protein